MPPLHVLVKPASGGCGLNCSYCFYADEMSLRAAGNRGMMTPQVQETMIRRVMEEAEGECSFSYQGGEPTLAGLAFFQASPVIRKALYGCLEAQVFLKEPHALFCRCPCSTFLRKKR